MAHRAYKRASPAVPPTRVVGLELKNKNQKNSTEGTICTNLRGSTPAVRETGQCTPGRGKHPPPSPARRGQSHKSGVQISTVARDPIVTLAAETGQSERRSRTARGGRDLDSSSLPHPRRTRGRLLPYKVLFSAVPAGGVEFLTEQWPCPWDSDPFSHPQDRSRQLEGLGSSPSSAISSAL